MSEVTEQPKSYGKVYKTLHWILVLNIGATMIFSYGMSDLSDLLKVSEYPKHAVSVTTIFILMVIRTIWRVVTPPPPIPMAESWQKRAAEFAHIAIYALIFAQIGLGILLSSTTSVEFVTEEYGINYTAWALVADSNHDLLLRAHKIGFFLLTSLVVVHILAALKHHFIDGDNVLRRMLPFARLKD